MSQFRVQINYMTEKMNRFVGDDEINEKEKLIGTQTDKSSLR
jgi:hypothetical protein